MVRKCCTIRKRLSFNCFCLAWYSINYYFNCRLQNYFKNCLYYTCICISNTQRTKITITYLWHLLLLSSIKWKRWTVFNFMSILIGDHDENAAQTKHAEKVHPIISSIYLNTIFLFLYSHHLKEGMQFSQAVNQLVYPLHTVTRQVFLHLV